MKKLELLPGATNQLACQTYRIEEALNTFALSFCLDKLHSFIFYIFLHYVIPPWGRVWVKGKEVLGTSKKKGSEIFFFSRWCSLINRFMLRLMLFWSFSELFCVLMLSDSFNVKHIKLKITHKRFQAIAERLNKRKTMLWNIYLFD